MKLTETDDEIYENLFSSSDEEDESKKTLSKRGSAKEIEDDNEN